MNILDIYISDSDAEEIRREERAKRPKVYRCSDRMCGGRDCATCYGEAAAAEFVASQDDSEDE